MESTHCYCNQPDDDVKRMLKCSVCQRYFHSGCLKSRKPSQLAGDIFFSFTCVSCSVSGVEQFERLKLLWLPVVILTLYNLQLSTTGQLGYYRWKEHICTFIDAHWVEFFGSTRKKTQTWYGTVAGTLSSWCPTYFLSGISELKQSGWWKLTDTSPPTVDILTATRIAKKVKSSDTTVVYKVDGLRNRTKRSTIEAAIELRAKRDIPLNAANNKCRKSAEFDVTQAHSPLVMGSNYDDDDDLCSEMTDASQMSASSLNAFDQSSQLSRSSCRSDWLTERDLIPTDTVPEFLLKDDEDDEDEDQFDIDIDTVSPSEPLSPNVQSSLFDDSLPQLTDILATLHSTNPPDVHSSENSSSNAALKYWEKDLAATTCPSLSTVDSFSAQRNDVSAPTYSTTKPRHKSSTEAMFCAHLELEAVNASCSQSSVVTTEATSMSSSCSESGELMASGYQSENEGSDVEEVVTKRRRVKPPVELVPASQSDEQSQLVPMSLYDEKQLQRKLKSIVERGVSNPKLNRLYRKLCVRQQQRELGLKVFNLDSFMSNRWAAETATENVSQESEEESNNVMRETYDSVGDYRILDRFQRSPGRCRAVQPVSFLSRLVGNENEQLHVIYSPYTNRALKPFIRRDYESRPLKMRLLMDIVAHCHRTDASWTPEPPASIDYCYVRPHHIPAVNALCREYFWPGIDLSECLEYPDFSGIVLYKKLVIGFAFMVPDVKYNEAYISFIFTHPEWRHAGIGSFLLYHLIQTCMGKDVTLHVAASNPAMLLYQKFGFKAEEFVLDFYDKYLPAESTECRHAFFLRLRR